MKTIEEIARTVSDGNGCPVWIERVSGGWVIHETPDRLDDVKNPWIVFDEEGGK